MVPHLVLPQAYSHTCLKFWMREQAQEATAPAVPNHTELLLKLEDNPNALRFLRKSNHKWAAQAVQHPRSLARH
jgi:hypothetical protein